MYNRSFQILRLPFIYISQCHKVAVVREDKLEGKQIMKIVVLTFFSLKEQQSE